MTRRPFPVPVAAVLAASAAATLLVPGVPTWAAGAAILATVARVARDRVGGEPAPPTTAGAVIVASLLALVAATTPFATAPGTDAAVRLLVGALGFEVVWALSPPPFGHPALLLLLSLAQSTLVASLRPSAATLAGAAAYAAAFVVALGSLARSSPFPLATAGARRIRSASASPRRWGTVALALPLVLLALPLSAAVTLVARRAALESPRARGGEAPGGRGASGGASGLEPLRTTDDRDASSAFVSGARTGARFGFVEAVKRDDTPALVVRRLGAPRPLEVETLVGMTYDLYVGDGWLRSPEARASRSIAPDPATKWIDLGPSPGPGPRRRIEVTDVRGEREGHLFLEPGTERVRFEVADPGFDLSVDGVAFARAGFPPEARYRVDSRRPPDAEAVGAAESDGASAPLPTYAAPPPDAEEYRRLAAPVVAAARTDAEQALRLAAWLRATHAYTLRMPDLDRRRPVLEFLRKRSPGHCELFASSLVLLLRSLGHPARLALGFRGGEPLDEERIQFRGSHAHAWCQMWFRDVGWIDLDPTPPDSEASGDDLAGTADAARDPDSDPEKTGPDESTPLDRVGSIVRSILPWTLLATVVAAILLSLLRRRRAAFSTLAGSLGGLPAGAYARALAALRDAGIARRRFATPSEFLATATTALPPIAEPFERLTRRHEEERYGERPPSGEERRGLDADARRIVATSKARRAPRPGRQVPRGPGGG